MTARSPRDAGTGEALDSVAAQTATEGERRRRAEERARVHRRERPAEPEGKPRRDGEHVLRCRSEGDRRVEQREADTARQAEIGRPRAQGLEPRQGDEYPNRYGDGDEYPESDRAHQDGTSTSTTVVRVAQYRQTAHHQSV